MNFECYEFHMYESAGHGFFYYDKPVYRPEACQDGWEKIFDFLEITFKTANINNINLFLSFLFQIVPSFLLNNIHIYKAPPLSFL